jgi:eukaryotic-like serine/threonine-protein kinase
MMDEDPLIGTVLADKYEVVERIGTGGMGAVYKALQRPFDRPVAVKVLVAGLAEDASILSRFENEARIISKLHRPHTLRPIDFGRAQGRLFLVTELLLGEPLNRVLARGPIGVERTAAMLEQVASSLDEAHELGIVHRDLKPANLFVQDVGGKDYFRVLDFGIAKLREAPALTAEGSFLGTPAYVSPEQARGEDVGPQSDLYSLGVIAYECLTGRPPFESKDPLGVLFKHLHDDPVPVAERAESVPEALAALVDSMLSKLPSERPQSAAEIVESLRVLAAPASTSVPASTSFPAVAQQRSRIAGIAIALLALVIATSAYLEFGSSEPTIVPLPPPPIAAPPPKPEPVVEAEPTVAPEPVVELAPKKPLKAPRRKRVDPPPVSPPSVPTANVQIEVWTTAGRTLNAQIFVDGQPMPKTAPASVSLGHGRHEIRVEAPGFPPKTKTVDIAGDTRVRFAADL